MSADDGLLVIDRNSDGLIDAQDEAFKQLRVWCDLNQDDISQENELFTLESLNIQSLNTAYQDVSTRLGNGNNHFCGGAGNDVLIIGIGNDYLVGGEGRDTYIFVKGHGRDTVSNYDSGSISIDNLLAV
ncbi:FrpA/C-like protein [Neisseria animaloris]|nr:hypothetical protein BWD08_09065 [Neisseria animaloris]VEH88022.1 FrpA/C-like protein [Neisseria animaloris]